MYNSASRTGKVEFLFLHIMAGVFIPAFGKRFGPGL
jgi:hypothetical protein